MWKASFSHFPSIFSVPLQANFNIFRHILSPNGFSVVMSETLTWGKGLFLSQQILGPFQIESGSHVAQW